MCTSPSLRRPNQQRELLWLALVLGWVGLPVIAECQEKPVDPTAGEIEFFEKRIRPLLINQCYECHSGEADELGGNLRLDSPAGLSIGGDSGPAVNLDDPSRSLLLRAVRYNDPLLQMPPDAKLSSDEISALLRWIEMGVPDPRESLGHNPQQAEPSEVSSDWWSFKKVRDWELPRVQDGDWPTAPIDFFVLAQLEAADFQPPPSVDRRTLIRRVTYDLLGHPPTPAEIRAFVSDRSPDAFTQLVDRLLASPHYGERWGRHWLDVVRYADTSGCNGDFPVAEAYRYRNYVINAFNKDKRFNQFVREQIAGDLLPASSELQRHEQQIATGYLAISRRFSSLGEEFHLTLDDTLDNLGKALLGLTVSCARCHDHKFDPIPQTDYYALYGIFQSTKYAFPGTEIYRHTRHHVPLVADGQRQEIEPLLAAMDKLDEEIFTTYSTMAELDTGKEKDQLRKVWGEMKNRRDQMLKDLPDFDKAYAVSEGVPVDVQLHIKGDPTNLGNQVPRGFLSIVDDQQLGDVAGSGRLELADWLVNEANHLTARVIVNRIWQHHFGAGLVRTPNDFGTRGAAPTHPRLLDYLTRQFIEQGWSTKGLHRTIVLSRTYQMAVVENANYAQADPQNKRLWTFRRRRLNAEATRDAMLFVSGDLDRSRGGPHPFKPEWKWRYSQHVPFVDDFPTRQRTVYVMQQRIRQQPYMGVFDGADANVATGIRQVSTTPQQALFMLNSDLIHGQSRALATRLHYEVAGEEAQIERAYLLAFGRPPSSYEATEALNHLERMMTLWQEMGTTKDSSGVEALASYLRVILSSNEFVFIE